MSGGPRRFVALAVAAVLAVGAVGVRSAPQAAAAPTSTSPRWALLVGVNAYRAPVQKTAGSVGDVQDLEKALLDAGWPADHIRTLTDDQATGDNIRAGWRWLQSVSTDSSFSIFHYSGHTKQQPGDKDHDGEDVDEYLWPVDNNFLSDSEMSNNMRAVKGWVWVDMSGCEAAGFDDHFSSTAHLFTAASRETEKAYDSADWKNSIFTGLLADKGMNQGLGDANHDGVVTIQEAFSYAAAQAPDLTKRQSAGPQHPYTAGGDGHDWYLDPPAPPAPAPSDNPKPGGLPYWPLPVP